MFAATALLGTTTGTVAEPATACAERKKPGFDNDSYVDCASAVTVQRDEGIITEEEYQEKLIDCCLIWGGVPDLSDPVTVYCDDPSEDPGNSPWVPQLPQVPFPTEATQPPPPPPTGPIAPLPSVPPVQTG